jgi:hypothetical protein
MDKRYFTIPLMLTVEAESFAEAFNTADKVAEGLGTSGENVYAAHEDGFDNNDQRVYYLPPKEYSNFEWDTNDV